MTDTDQDLELALAIHEEVNEAFAPENPESFTIETMEGLQWYTGKMEALVLHIRQHQEIAERKRQKLNEIFNRELERIESAFLASTTDYRHSLNYLSRRFGNQAHAFILQHLKTLKKTKSFKLNNAQYGVRKEAAKYEIANAESIIAWAIAQGRDELLDYTPKIKMQDLKEYAKRWKEPIEGLKITEGQEKFYAQIAGMDIMAITGNAWNEQYTEDAPNEPERNNSQQGEGDSVLQD